MFERAAGETHWPTIENLAARSSALFIKKLARNDTSWADDPGKHQAGFYIPKEVREAGFFPPLIASNPDKPHIFSAPCITLWPQTGEIKNSGLRHYSNKGPETHFTGIPHDVFAGLSPASLLVCGKYVAPEGGATHWFIILDSNSEDAEVLETALDVGSDFHYGLFNPSALLKARALATEEVEQLIDQIKHAIRSGTLDSFIRSVSRIPAPESMAAQAQQSFLDSTGACSLDPFALERPGDAIMQISRDIEYAIFKRLELRRRAAEIAELLTGEADLVRAIVTGFGQLDAIFLSASQQRKTRAGRSFEHHIARTLRDGGIAYEEQAVLGGRRPDFVMPDRGTLALGATRSFLDALILSAKTTLRERWKQITHERFNCAIFLATVDDRVSKPALDEMQSAGIGLVVPESLKTSKETFYAGHPNVMTFRDFFDHEVKQKRPFLLI